MKIEFDKIADALYIRLKHGKIACTQEISDLVNMDVDSKGAVIGIEMLNISEQFQAQEMAELEKNIKKGVPAEIVSTVPKLV